MQRKFKLNLAKDNPYNNEILDALMDSKDSNFVNTRRITQIELESCSSILWRSWEYKEKAAC